MEGPAALRVLWRGLGVLGRVCRDCGAVFDGFDLTMLEIGAFHPLWAGHSLGAGQCGECV